MDAKVLIYFNIRKFYHKFLSKSFEFPAFLFRNLEFPTLFTPKITQKIATSQTQEVTIAVSHRIFKPLQLSHIVSQFQNLRMYQLKHILSLLYRYL